MRIAMITESPSMPSGFGGQVRMLCEEWAKSGHEMFLLTNSVPLPIVPLHNTQEWRFTELTDIARIESHLNAIQPQVLMVFGCTGFVSYQLRLRTAAMNCPVLFWLPYEGSMIPEPLKRDFRGMPKNACIHLTAFAQRMWINDIDTQYVVPHGYDPEIWKYDPDFSPQDRTKLRRKWAEKIKFPIWDDDFVVFNCDRNIGHKRWDATCDYIKKLQDRMPNRRVVLLDHTKKLQEADDKQPAGYDIPQLAEQYGVRDQVAFTNFNWWQSVDREDIVELMKLCDIRLTTSAGEGFGIPIVEAAAVGTLQIVNGHTTAKELLGPENPSIVSPAMIESKMGSLWPLADTAEMVQRTLDFISDDSLATYARESSRLWVEGRFQSPKVAALLMQIFENEIQSSEAQNLQVTRCWGMRDDYFMPLMFGDCGRVITHLTKKSVLELGARAGMFVETCAELGLSITGMENRPEWLEKLALRARPFILNQDIQQPWPTAEVVVATDMQDVWLEQTGSVEATEEILKQLTFYDWALLRFNPRYIWNKPTINKDSCYNVLTANGLDRRTDLETVIRGKFPNFQHELWQNSATVEPEGLKHFLGMQ